MKIILMRHGRPVIDLEVMKNLRKSPAEVGQMVDDYLDVELDKIQNVPEISLQAAKPCNVVFSSDLRRALTSLEWLNKPSNTRGDACFREIRMPYLTWSNPKLRFNIWHILFWLTWIIGFARNGDSIKPARRRAAQGADILAGAALQDEAVLLLGHAILNWLIATELKKLGWRRVRSTGYSYWSFIEMEKF